MEPSPVVASLSPTSPHPYSSISASPDRSHAVVAGKDNTLSILVISPTGLSAIKTWRISQHFQTLPTPSPSSQYGDLRETFGLRPSGTSSEDAVVHCNHVAWSSSDRIAAAGSNGVVVVWNLAAIWNSQQNPMPEAVLSQHTRAVNRLAWHPTAVLLLTASQDASVKLWERRTSSQDVASTGNTRSWFGINPSFMAHSAPGSVSWHCKATFQPRSETVRDICWSPFLDDVFAIVTGSGSLIVYNVNVSVKPWVKIQAHYGEATSVDWHPTHTYVLATGGGSQDKRVKVWDLESKMGMAKDERMVGRNSNSARSDLSHGDSSATDYSNDEKTVKAGPRSNVLTQDSSDGTALTSWGPATRSLSTSTHGSHRVGKYAAADALHVLSIAASITRVRWRPPSSSNIPLPEKNHHDAMLAVATDPIKGASAGGSGVLSLWSHHRPFMALSVLEGHTERAVADFIWLDTPKPSAPPPPPDPSPPSRRKGRREDVTHRQSTPQQYRMDAPISQSREAAGIWQHVLSVGRDGRCLLQSFVRGERPISRVPPSCFALANLSPFQSGSGSLQIFSVHQNVPSKKADDFYLTGLRRDLVTSRAPGVFREGPPRGVKDDPVEKSRGKAIQDRKHPVTSPDLVFNVIDQGELDDKGRPVTPKQSSRMVAPEVVHFSRFADGYKMYVDKTCPTRVSLCLHNAKVAENLHRGTLSRMWQMLASIVEGSGLQDLAQDPNSFAANAMEFVLLPTLKGLLEERANAGDVQTCVAICEVMQVVEMVPDGDSQRTRIPGLELKIVREWYLTYIDLLQQMCLFSHATNLIRNSKDTFIGALNQQSTTIFESCPHCLKPQLGGEGTSSGARRACKNCRRPVGLCFLCHQTVQGVFVWCPGCGHGGHIDCALQWFGGMTNGGVVREVCPTGCGHKCNLVQQVKAFPRTVSLAKFTCADADVFS